MSRKQRRRAAIALPKGVHRIIARGREFFYFQAGRGTSVQGPRIRLPDDPQSPEFWQKLREAQGKSDVEESPYLIGPAVDAYLNNAAAKTTLAPDTHYHYARSLQIAKDAWGSLPVAGLRPAHVAKAVSNLSATPSKANHFLAVMKQFSGWAIVEGIIDQSLVEGVKPYKLDGGHKPWTKEQLAAADKHLTGVVRQGYMLYRYTGQRGGDVVKLGPTHIDEGGFTLAQAKTGREIWCPILPELASEIASWERRAGPYLLQANGKPYTRKLFWKHFDEARENIPALADVTLHGLRCTAVINLRRHGLSEGTISDIVGMSVSTIQRYCRFADRKESGKAALVVLADKRRTKADEA